MGKQMSVIRGVSSLVALILILGSLGALVLAQESTIGITAQATVASFKWGSWSAQGFSVRVDVQNRGAAPIEFGDTLIVWQGSRDTSTISGEAFVEGDYQVADTREVRDKKRYFVDSFRGVQRDGKVTLSGMSVGPDGAVTIGATTTQMCRLNASGRLIGVVAPGASSGFQCDVPVTPLRAPEQVSTVWIAFPELVDSQTRRKQILVLEGRVQAGASLVQLSPRFIAVDSPTLRTEALANALPLRLLALAMLTEIEGNEARAFLQERFERESVEPIQTAIIADLARLPDQAAITAWLLDKVDSLPGLPYREALQVLVKTPPPGLTTVLMKQLGREIELRNVDPFVATLNALAAIRDKAAIRTVDEFRNRVKKSQLDSRTKKAFDDLTKETIRSIERKN